MSGATTSGGAVKRAASEAARNGFTRYPVKAEVSCGCNSCRVEGVNITMRCIACARAAAPSFSISAMPSA